MKNTDHKLVELIETKAFQELNVDERAFVLDHISESEYDLRRDVLFSSNEVLEEEGSCLTPDPRIKSNLSKALRRDEKKVSLWDQLAAFVIRPVPAYQFAVAFSLLVLVFSWKLNDGSPEIVYQDKIVYQEIHDTVYVDVPVVEVKTVDRIIYVRQPEPKQDYVAANRDPYESDKDRMAEAAAQSNAFAFTDEQLENHKQKSFGNTGIDPKELTQFIGILDQ